MTHIKYITNFTYLIYIFYTYYSSHFLFPKNVKETVLIFTSYKKKENFLSNIH